MLGCGIKQTNHSRYSAPPAPPAPQRTWTGEGMSPKGLGWKQESRCQLAFQTLNDVDKEAWRGAPGDTWRSRRVCQKCAEQFSTSVSTVKPQHPNRLLSHLRPKSTSRPSAPVLRSSATAVIIKKVSYHHPAFPSWSSITADWTSTVFKWRVMWRMHHLQSSEALTPDRCTDKAEGKGVQKAAICASQTSGASPSFSSHPFNTE